MSTPLTSEELARWDAWKRSSDAVIERVLSDVDNAKSQCFKKSYGRVKTKVPPYLPFVIQMRMN